MKNTHSITCDVESDFGGRFGQKYEALRTMMPKVLDLFKENNIKATFFVEAQTLEDNFDLIQRAQNEGHEIASHGFGHIRLTADNIEENLKKTKEIFDKYRITPKGFRAPYLIAPKELFAKLEEYEYTYDASKSRAWFPGRYNTLSEPKGIHKIGNLIEIPTSTIPFTTSTFTVLQSRLRLPGNRWWKNIQNAVCFFHAHDIHQWDKQTISKLPIWMRPFHWNAQKNWNALEKIIKQFSNRKNVKMEELAESFI